MSKVKIILAIGTFSILLGITSIIKNQTRVLEKKIYKFEKRLAVIEKDLHETQLDFSYLSSPSYLSKKITELAYIDYMPMDFSRIYLSYLNFSKAQKKMSILKEQNEKETKKK